MSETSKTSLLQIRVTEDDKRAFREKAGDMRKMSSWALQLLRSAAGVSSPSEPSASDSPGLDSSAPSESP